MVALRSVGVELCGQVCCKEAVGLSSKLKDLVVITILLIDSKFVINSHKFYFFC
jgi:hypothetical protein